MGSILAVLLLVLGYAVIKPAVTKLLVLGPKAAGGDTAAAAEVGVIIGRLRKVGYAQIVLGVTILAAMVLARFS